eukprot:974993-Pleurochrysis_carterae.AAC.1
MEVLGRRRASARWGYLGHLFLLPCILSVMHGGCLAGKLTRLPEICDTGFFSGRRVFPARRKISSV